MLNLDIRKSIFIHSGTFIINCVMQWMQSFCSTQAPAHFLKSTPAHPRMTQTLLNCHFLIFVLVNLVRMVSPREKLLKKVKQIVVPHLPLFLSDPFLSSEVPEHRAGLREEGSGMASQILLYTSSHISLLDHDLVVEFTDDEADEIY